MVNCFPRIFFPKKLKHPLLHAVFAMFHEFSNVADLYCGLSPLLFIISSNFKLFSVKMFKKFQRYSYLFNYLYNESNSFSDDFDREKPEPVFPDSGRGPGPSHGDSFRQDDHVHGRRSRLAAVRSPEAAEAVELGGSGRRCRRKASQRCQRIHSGLKIVLFYSLISQQNTNTSLGPFQKVFFLFDVYRYNSKSLSKFLNRSLIPTFTKLNLLLLQQSEFNYPI
jgi:hypothetical protein